MGKKNTITNKGCHLFRDERGFTLVELLIALTIFLVVGMASFSIFQESFDVRDHLSQVQKRLENTWTDFFQLSSELASADNFYLRAFQGTAEALRFTGYVKVAGKGRFLCTISYEQLYDPQQMSRKLVKRISDFRGNSRVEELYSSLEFARFSYLKVVQGERKWVDTWEDPTQLPIAVRVQVQPESRTERAINRVYPVRNQTTFTLQ